MVVAPAVQEARAEASSAPAIDAGVVAPPLPDTVGTGTWADSPLSPHLHPTLSHMKMVLPPFPIWQPQKTELRRQTGEPNYT